MAERVIMPVALDSNGDIVSGATAHFFERGTVTPLTVYEDENATTPHMTPVTASAAGVFEPVFTLTPLKVDIRDTLGASLPGYPSDPAYVMNADATGASSVTFTPISGNAAGNVQAAIQNLTNLWNNVTTWGRSLIAAKDATAARATLGLKSAAIADLLDEDDMASDSEDDAPSQQSVKAYVDASIFGAGQSRQDVSGSRTAGVSYENTSGAPLEVSVIAVDIGTLEVSLDSTTWMIVAQYHSDRAIPRSGSAIVGPGEYYRYNGSAFTHWTEYRV